MIALLLVLLCFYLPRKALMVPDIGCFLRATHDSELRSHVVMMCVPMVNVYYASSKILNTPSSSMSS